MLRDEPVRPWLRVALLGASGLVGSAVRAGLGQSAEVIEVPAPRVLAAESVVRNAPNLAVSDPTSPKLMEAVAAIASEAQASRVIDSLAFRVRGADVIVNAAGLASPGAARIDAALAGANAVLPVIVVAATAAVGAACYVHVSSAAVCNSARPYTNRFTDRAAFTAYQTSKSLGEVFAAAGSRIYGANCTIYRPTSLLHPSRPATRHLRLALRCGALPDTESLKLPCCTSESVGRAVRDLIFLSRTTGPASHAIYIHPYEEVTAASLYRVAGYRASVAARTINLAGSLLDRVSNVGPLSAAARRLDLVRNGGWSSTEGSDEWRVDGIRSTDRELAAGLFGPSQSLQT